MTTPDPELRRVEPTGNPRVDALIDAMVCPSCRTIYNAAKAKCADPWHHDNRPEPDDLSAVLAKRLQADQIDLSDLHEATFGERIRRAMATQRITVLPPAPELAQVDVDNAWNRGYERGVAEGRRQATEGWDREWRVDLGGGWPEHPCDSEADAHRVAAARPGRSVVSRLVGPWEPAEQAAPTCTCPMIDVTNVRADGGEGIRTFVQGLDPACPTCVRANAVPAPCPTCSGPIRETVGMVCQTCGTDYAPAEQDGDGR